MKVAELTVEELQSLIRETVEEVLAERFDESSPPVQADLVDRLSAPADAGADRPAAEVARHLGLQW